MACNALIRSAANSHRIGITRYDLIRSAKSQANLGVSPIRSASTKGHLCPSSGRIVSVLSLWSTLIRYRRSEDRNFIVAKRPNTPFRPSNVPKPSQRSDEGRSCWKAHQISVFTALILPQVSRKPDFQPGNEGASCARETADHVQRPSRHVTTGFAASGNNPAIARLCACSTRITIKPFMGPSTRCPSACRIRPRG